MVLLDVPNPLEDVGRLNPPKRLLCGPGPGNAHPRVHAVMSLPQIGHMDPAFLSICEDLKSLLRYVWQTNNLLTLPVSGTGSAAWEATIANLTCSGDVHLVFVNGYFGERHCDMASRYNADVRRVEKRWGDVFTLQEITEAVHKHLPQIVWLCYAETSTGALQNIEGVGELCRSVNCLFLLDTVTAIAGVPLYLDKMLVDVAYAGTQKCLSCPPGVAPVTFGDRAIQKMADRAERFGKVNNWYLDMNMIRKYIVDDGGAKRVYHHTAPISMIYACREALTLVAEEGLEAVWERHRNTAEYFWKLVEEAGLQMFIDNKAHRLPSLHTVRVPQGVNADEVVRHLREVHCIEIGGGLGEQMAGKVWRVGLMGYNSRKDVALTVVSAMKEALILQGWTPKQHNP
eukprot:GHVS01042620.1.p1 GENE.GHVS01042620.1~~GHVS01042620.1.p1  ORF type:complete len:400 (-),score=61.52 GHVS01042620.1:170-1369(-)